MDVYEELVAWARDKGVELHGVAPREFPGRGVGIVVTKHIKPGDLLLRIPSSVLRTADTVRPEVKESLPKDTKVHALLAADLALDSPTSEYSIWNAVVPSREAITTSLPLAWDTRLHPYLPKPALAILRKQQAKFNRDWAVIQQSPLAAGSSSSSSSTTTTSSSTTTALTDKSRSPTTTTTTTTTTTAKTGTITRQTFLYTWLLVNTRTFYHETAGAAAHRARDDRMVLQPVADLLNHAAAGYATAGFDGAGGIGWFTVAADRAYAPGEEVHICYGRHHNDLLLVEYGFLLADNRWDEVGLDDAVLPALSGAQRALLDERGFLGNYVLDAGTVCYRTRVALRLLCCVSAAQWERLVNDGEDGGEALQEEVDRLLVRLLKKYRGTVVEGKIRELEALDVGLPSQREILRTRWQQIGRLIDQTIDRLDA
ncbi:hypothetical protein MYCTH_2297882 [Thermothelomyces thermophilus ATCC 42464]|uniref:SET domain-containing protein n=1 Tax=Thermothelomyces thermophilus (strain ATCC 42464 / BCRC 31852 / DSM 1799) TaxID=573729 RepID=G2Q003_THET4|nr:uncharacterized protein MYCTH_2297882 [Thermothelomyces thermophilus ATCC 42464]AEO54827.1 hypothetical protein MYCTH_2297882 [Thermothelomyces thermophilus ATCC 42464]